MSAVEFMKSDRWGHRIFGDSGSAEVRAKFDMGKETIKMKKMTVVLCLVVVLNAGIIFAVEGSDKISVATMPPVVVKTIPQSGDTSVSPALKEIRVTFSKEMLTKDMWSWVKVSDDTFPAISGKVRYLGDGITCVLPVKLEAGRTYVIWINSDRSDHFRDTTNLPAVPYLLVFQTK